MDYKNQEMFTQRNRKFEEVHPKKIGYNREIGRLNS